MTGLVVVLFVAAAALGLFESSRAGRRRHARDRLVRDAIAKPGRRGAAVEALRQTVAAVERRRARSARLLGNLALERELSELRLALALLLLVEDRPEDALDMLVLINPDRIPSVQRIMLAMHAVEAHLRLGEWHAAERVLDGYSAEGLNDNGRALRANARAQIRLGRDDPRSALRCLDEIDPVPVEVKPDLELTRARALAALGHDAGEVLRILNAQSASTLELLIRRHGGEPATQVARRILNDRTTQ